MKISKKIREEAALLCAIAANEPRGGLGLTISAVQRHTGIGGLTTWRLALRAHSDAYEAHGQDYELACAEAASMLLDGWSPE